VLPNVDCASVAVALGRAPANRFIRDGGKAIVAFARRANIPVHIVPVPGKPRPDEPDPHINNVNASHDRVKQNICLEKLGVRYRAAYGFGRTERLRERDRRVDRLQAMLEGGPMRFKPVPPNWGNRRLDRRNRLTATCSKPVSPLASPK